VRVHRLGAAGILVVLISTAAWAQTSTPWVSGPSLGAIADDVAVVSWETSRQVSVDLHYALAGVYDASGVWTDTLTFDRQEGHAEVWISGLEPDSEYRYQLIAYEGDAVYPTRIGSFRTSGPDIRSFSFIVYGNTRSFPDRHKLVADAIARDEAGAAFVAHVGALTDAYTSERLANFHWAISDLSRSIPYVAVVGSNVDDQTPYFETFALPQGGGTAGEQWWSFRFGDVLLVGLDGSLDDPETTRAQEQLTWLRRTLREADAPLCVVLSSEGLYHSGSPDGANEGLVALWEPALAEFDVDVLASASVGGYEHIYCKGIHHITTGGGGGPLVDSAENRVSGLVFSRYGVLHYLRFTVADDVMRVEAVPVASIIDDEVFLTPSDNPIDAFVVQ